MKYKKIVRFIKKHRSENRAGFQILTTSDTIIIVEPETREQIRLNY